MLRWAVQVPAENHYTLNNANVPVCLVSEDAGVEADTASVDHTALLDIEVLDGTIASMAPAGKAKAKGRPVDCAGRMVWPTFVDLHTHIDKSHTCERSRNVDGSLSGADRSTASDAQFWDYEDLYRRMDFAVQCAYAHGTSALRTHLINMNPTQTSLTWPAFRALRQRWAGRVELQAVCLVVLSFFRDPEAAAKLADTVAEHRGVLGAAVCCAENGGDPSDDWTTCDRDRDQLLDRMFQLARERDLDLDFHVDENGNVRAQGLLHVARKTVQHGWQGRVVCGHCCSLAMQPPKEQARIMEAARAAGITVVSLPLVNEWTQDRAHVGDRARTPQWRGVTALHELHAAGVATALASDNVRDQFYAYGDFDMLDVFSHGCRLAHLDRPYAEWPRAVCSTPAAAMKLPSHGVIHPGGPANLVVFRARCFSELLARPQHDRVVIRDGRPTGAFVPDYSELGPGLLEEGPLQPAASAGPLRRLNSRVGEESFKAAPLGLWGRASFWQCMCGLVLLLAMVAKLLVDGSSARGHHWHSFGFQALS